MLTISITCPYCDSTQETFPPEQSDEDGYLADTEYNLEICQKCKATFAFRLMFVPTVTHIFTLQPAKKLPTPPAHIQEKIDNGQQVSPEDFFYE